MAKIKHTKNELKAQRDALARYRRYLPTLLLKKQQLQLELRQVEGRLAEKRMAEDEARAALGPWIKLFSEPFDFSNHLRVERIDREIGNIAGVNIPILRELTFHRETPNLFTTPPWIDDGLKTLEDLFRLRVERRILEEQQRLLAEELRVTSQRVNLFEKVKIPESRENIRVIRIFLGDQDIAAVARSKIAKGKTEKAGAL